MPRSPRRRRWVALGLVLVLALAVVGFGAPPARRAAAAAITHAPNRGAGDPAPMPGEQRIPVRGATIAVELVDAPGASATVFVLHGIRDRRDSMRGVGAAFAARGVRAVLVDLRGHGRSTGDVLSYGVFDRADLATVASTLEAHGDVKGPIGVYGYSYGAATAIEWAGDDPRVRAVVAVAPFVSLRRIVPEYTPLPLPRSFVDSCVDEAGAEGGFDPDAASPLGAIARTKAPVLLLHGDADERIPIAHSRELAAAGHAELIVVPGATHESIGGASELRDRAIPWLVDRLTAP
jgi:alpha-beta hydrolase superfamily lysophospholipase